MNKPMKKKSNPVVLLRLPPGVERVNNRVTTKLCYVTGIDREEKIGQLPTSSAERWGGTTAILVCSDRQRDKVQDLIKEGVNTLYVKIDSYEITRDNQVIIYPSKEPNEVLSINRATHQWEECFIPPYRPQEELGEGERYIVYYANPKKGFEREPVLCSTAMSLEDVINTLEICYSSSNSDCMYISRVDNEGDIESYSYTRELITKR
jgi:hypothetical protein